MSGSDSFQLVVTQLVKDIASVNDTLALIGIFYVGKLSLKILSGSIAGIKSYILPSLFSNSKWLKSLGNYAVVTGCTHGIGLAYAKELAKLKINLILVARNSELLDKVANNFVEKYGIEVIKVVADLNDLNSYENIEKAIVSRDVGILVNNAAALSEVSNFHSMSRIDIDRTLNVNSRAIIHTTSMVLPQMIKKNKGAIVNISSGLTDTPGCYFSIYTGTKVLVEKFTEALRYEYRNTKIFFQILKPGLTKTHGAVAVIGKQAQLLNMDAIRYASSALKTLGYTNYTCGHWFFALQNSPRVLFPDSVKNWIFAKIVEASMKKDSSKTIVPNDYVYNDLDLILNH